MPALLRKARPILLLLTTAGDVIENNMEAVLIEKSRTAVRDTAFFEAVLWHPPTLVNAGVLNRTEAGVEFPYDQLHFEFDVKAAA